MNLIKIATHPYTITISFSIIVIIGQSWGGFFLFYLLLGLPYAAVHSLIGFAGIALLFLNYYKYKKKGLVLRYFTEIFAIILLLLSLFVFFHNDKHYNDATFRLTGPAIMLVQFLLIASVSVVKNIVNVFRILSTKNLQNLNL